MRLPAHKIALISGALLGLLGVLIGAFGAHALDNLLRVNQRVDTYELANRYQFYHAIALITIGIVAGSSRPIVPSLENGYRYASLCLVFGTLIFSGSLYALAITNMGVLGAVTPIGGVLLLLGWLLFLVSVIKR